jgi:succinate dehydrogenase / fumarate reductase, membrane anchor subunit
MYNNFKTDLKVAKNLGSSGHGAKHWLHQRLSAILIIMLMIWLIYFIKIAVKSDAQTLIPLIKQPLNLVAFLLLITSSFYHGVLGMQVVIEDYISCLFFRNIMIVTLKIFSLITVLSLFIALGLV